MAAVKRSLAATVLVYLAGCGGNGGPIMPPGGGAGYVGTGSGGVGGIAIPTGPNVMELVVDSGPAAATYGYTNGLFATVKLCQPGTTNCQVIDHMLLDTGSTGVRVLESLVTTLQLPDVVDGNGQTLGECAPFVDGSTWGPLKTADIVLGGEIASSLPIQLIGTSRFSMPSDCTGSPITNLDELGTNGILGVGIFTEDCGTACTRTFANPGYYYACTDAAVCRATAVPVDQQVKNPVAALPVDNNGVIIQLPSVPEMGTPQVPGVMLLGIGTQANNGLGNATPLALDRYGEVSTTYPVGGTPYVSIIDSGSNGLFFLNTATTGLKMCTEGLQDFYCPATTAILSATILGASSLNVPVDFAVANTEKLDACKNCFAFSNLGGPMPGFPADSSIPAFDWGLPFFFGRTVYTAFENNIAGPFLAF